MTIFVDTGVFYAHQNERADGHEAARQAFDVILAGEYGQPFTNEFVFDEVLTLVRRRTNSHEEAMTVADRILGRNGFPTVFRLLSVDRADFQDSLETFSRYTDQHLSFTDATILAHLDRRDIDTVLTFDSDFDSLARRVDPGEV